MKRVLRVNGISPTRRNEFFRFAATGTGAFLVDSLALLASLAFGAGFYAGRALSWLAAATFSWRVNRQWTFRTVGTGSALREWGRFLLVNALGGCVNFAIYALLLQRVSGVWTGPVIAVAAGSIAGLSINYFLSRHWVFYRRPDFL
jgi:putative flippase GtrA